MPQISYGAVEPVKLAFCLYKYFPYGGLQRDFLRIARECQRRGHEIRVYTLEWSGDIPDGFEVIIVPVTSLTNHNLYEKFSQWVREALRRDPVDGVVGINKMPGLDVYYAADSCYEEKARTQRNWLYRLLPRYRHFASYERAVFSADSETEILMISEAQKPLFKKYYGTPDNRLHFLPPGISKDRVAPENADEIRREVRRELDIDDGEHLVLMIGSGFIKKGLKRALYAIKALPRNVRKKTRFLVVGEDNPVPFKRLITLLGLRKRVSIVSGRDDIPRILLGGDLLIHPALDENAGIILLEATVAGLPVLATENCGYGHYVKKADVGELVSNPFSQDELNRKLLRMLQCDRRREWRENGRRFARTANIYSMPQEASRVIENVLTERSQVQSDRGTLAFCLYKYFPYGGLQRDFVRVAAECVERGYKIRVYTLSWAGEIPADFDVIVVPVKSITNHARYQKFYDWVSEHLSRNPVKGVIGFNKMPGLDIYYAADSCYEEKARSQRGPLYRSIPRYKHFSRFEQAVFDPAADTEIFMLTETQKLPFLKHYGTPDDRIHILPPGISRDRIAPDNAHEIGNGLRAEFGVAADEYLLLMVGSGFITKGLERIIVGMNALPEGLREKTKLIAVGQDNPRPFHRMAKRLGLESQVRILSGRDDIPRFLLGADLLVHPAINENAGMILLEAIVAGLPVLATDVCGYARYVEESRAGELVPSPYRQEVFDKMLVEMLTSDERDEWRQNGLRFATYADIYSMPERVADLICKVIG